MKLPFIMAFLILLFPFLVIANSGRTNSKGSRTNRKTGEFHGQNKNPSTNKNSTKSQYKESVYQKVWCFRNSGQVEVALQDKTRAARVLIPFDDHKKKRRNYANFDAIGGIDTFGRLRIHRDLRDLYLNRWQGKSNH